MSKEHLKKLLNEMLKNPHSGASEEIEMYIECEAGRAEFLEHIRQNDALVFIYMKHSSKKWCENGRDFFYSDEFLRYVVNAVHGGNMPFVCDFLSQLSMGWKITRTFMTYLIGERKYVFLRAIFQKYTQLPRSNELFSEIKFAISEISPILDAVYFDEGVVNVLNSIRFGTEESKSCGNEIREISKQIGRNGKFFDGNLSEIVGQIRARMETFFDGDLLDIVYCLVFQDIHEYFEDRAAIFFKVFFVLYGTHEETVLRIYDLFITKYPECTDFGAVISNLSQSDEVDGTIQDVFGKALLAGNIAPELVEQILRRFLLYTIDDDDMELYTRNVLSGAYLGRAAAARLIRLARPNHEHFDLEPGLFIATVLKAPSARLIEAAKKVIANATSQMVITNSYNPITFSETIGVPCTNVDYVTLVFSAFHYLITLREFGPVSLEFLHGKARFICLRYISLCLGALDTFHAREIIKVLGSKINDYSNLVSFDNFISFNCLSQLGYIQDGAHRSNLAEFYTQSFCKLLLESIICDMPDEFIAETICRIVFLYPELATQAIFEHISTLFRKIEVISVRALKFLFDVYLTLCLRFQNYNPEVIEHIMNNEFTDLYSFAFFYLSIIIHKTYIPKEFVITILTQPILWEEPSYTNSLFFLTLSAFKKGFLTRSDIPQFAHKLPQFQNVILLYQVGISSSTKNPVENFLINNVLDLEWFFNNFIEKKYARIVLKKLINTSGIDNCDIKKIVQKNIVNVDYEFVYRSIIIFFDL